MAISREALYEEVWSAPMTTVAKRYDVSSNYLARICESMNVPHPPRGYWAKVHAQGEAIKPELPPASGAHPTHWARGALPFTPRSTDAHQLPAPGLKPRKWARPSTHPLMDNVEALYLASYPADEGFLRPRKRSLPDVVASQAHLTEAMHLASELYLAFEDRGYRVMLSTNTGLTRRPTVDHRENPPPARGSGYDDYYGRRWHPSKPTVAAVGTLAIGISIYELSTSVAGRWHKGAWTPIAQIPTNYRERSALGEHVSNRDQPSGRFCIRVYSPYSVATWQREWREESVGQLFKRLRRICSETEADMPTLIQLIADGERRAEEQRLKWQREQEEAAKRAAEERRAKAHEASRKTLLDAIQAWAFVRGLESFFEDVERRINDLPAPRRESMSQRLQQARGVIGPADALQRFESWETPDEIFQALTQSRRYW